MVADATNRDDVVVVTGAAAEVRVAHLPAAVSVIGGLPSAGQADPARSA